MLNLISSIVNIKVVHMCLVTNDLCGAVVKGGSREVRDHRFESEGGRMFTNKCKKMRNLK